MRYAIALLVFVVTITSCERDTRIQKRRDGTWNVAQVTQTWYVNGVADSTVTGNDVGTLELESGEPYNNPMKYTQTSTVIGPYFGRYEAWWMDTAEQERIIFSIPGFYSETLIYTVEKNSRRKMELLLVGLDANGKLAFREQVVLKKQ